MEELLRFEEYFGNMLDPEDSEDVRVVQIGQRLYRQGMVFRSIESPDMIIAEVQDVIRYKVELDLDKADRSSCDCDHDSVCEHMAAVFFSAYSKIRSVNEWVSEWRQDHSPMNMFMKDLGIITAKDLLDTDSPLEKSYSAWKDFVTANFKESIENKLNLAPYILDDHLTKFFRKIEAKAPMEREWSLLYHFVTDFASLMNILNLIRKHPEKNTHARMFHSAAENLAEDLQAAVQQLSRQARPFAFDPFITGIKEDAAKLLEGRDMLSYEKTDLYRSIWSSLLVNSTWRKEEQKRVSDALENARQPEEKMTYTIAAIHLSLLSNENETAASLLKGLNFEACPYMFYWIRSFSENENEKQATPFIDFLVAHVREYLKDKSDYYYSTDFVRTSSGPVSSYCYKTKRMDLLDKFYRECLPYSYWNYSHFLFDQGSYKKWVEMHIYTDVSIDLISGDMIKVVSKEDPSLILPLYYHAVQQTVSQKNRSAYKQAVRYLKKMRTLYKKMKQEDVFNRYIQYVAQSTKRLRAFQEELQRGKLTDAN
ncbi:SWIM zinc finger family protein [Peribacillus sp. B-H-3]|uniref:SWIM zinc finger family protein n=1 Tax=Peribacillus sp. B-H-3 TaxID=3400420 RepID=UPI003B0181EA